MLRTLTVTISSPLDFIRIIENILNYLWSFITYLPIRLSIDPVSGRAWDERPRTPRYGPHHGAIKNQGARRGALVGDGRDWSHVRRRGVSDCARVRTHRGPRRTG